MTKALRYLFLVLLAAMLVLGYSVLPKVKFDSDVLALFPQDAQNPDIALANNLLAKGVTAKLFFLLSSADWQATKNATPVFADTLLQCECIDKVSSRQDAEKFLQLRRHYLQHAPVLLSSKDKVLLQEGQGDALVSSALREFMVNPTAVSAASLQQDPLGTVDDFVSGLRNQVAGKGAMEDGFLYFADENADRRYVLVIAELAGSPYSLTTQEAAQAAINEAFARFAETVPNASVIRTGAFFFARAGTEQARLEISTVGVGSVLGILLIFLLVFRSVALLAFALLPIAAGIVVGLTTTFLLFGSVHVIALVFGASLVGVSIDYSLHFLCKRQALGDQWQADDGLRALLPGLSLGLLTSVAGYLSFVAAGFPGLRQVAVFSCAGLIAAYVMVTGFYPWILRRPGKTAAPRFVRDKIPGYLVAARRRLRCLKHPEWMLPLAILAGIGFWQLDMLDDVRAMQSRDAQFMAEEKRFRELVGSVTAMQYLLVKADSQEALLQKLEQLQPALQQPEVADSIESYLNLARWLPSKAAQLANNTLIREQIIATGRFEDYLNTLGVNAETQARLLDAFTNPNQHSLELDNTLPLLHALLERPLYFQSGDQHYSFVLFDGLARDAPLRRLAEANENVFWVDRVATTSGLLELYKHRAAMVLAAAYVLILLLLTVRYGFSGALSVVAPPLLGSLFAVAALGWLGVGFSVFNVMALLLILGIGIDYTLFLRESGGRGYDTLFAIGLSSLTTLLSFGLLSLSATHAIYSFGITILLGIVMSFLLAPLSLPREPLPPQAHER